MVYDSLNCSFHQILTTVKGSEQFVRIFIFKIQKQRFVHGDPPLALTLEEGEAVFPRHDVVWSGAVKVRLDGDLHGSGFPSSLGL